MTIAPNLVDPYDLQAYESALGGPALQSTIAGFWRVFAFPCRRGFPPQVDVTMFRGAPTQIKSLSFSDPFGAKDASIVFPQITAFDRRGEGDLWWLTPFCTFVILWEGPLPSTYAFGYPKITGAYNVWYEPTYNGVAPGFDWSGRAMGFHYSTDGLSVDLQGAMYQLDDWLAKPEYPPRPYPYEWAIIQQFLYRPSLRVKHPVVWFPTWWSTTYSPPPKGTPTYMIPIGVVAGQKTTALWTRQTGSWDPMLTSYIQSLLAAMYTDRGRWTLDLMAGEQPALFHRDFQTATSPGLIVIDPTLPDVNLTIDEDWSQSISSVYGQGTALNGDGYSGMQVIHNGQLTVYEPLAALRQVHPENTKNPWYDSGRAVREVLMQMQTGLNELQAEQVARFHLERFNEPGMTGTVEVSSAVNVGGELMPPHMIRAGMSIQVPNIYGRPDGLVAHVTENEIDFENEKNTLTFDTKYRDALTVNEARLRGRDALQVQRMLVVGQYQPPIPDQLIPWNYGEGSGMVPCGPVFNSLPLFDSMPIDEEFPWENWTKAHPPSNARWRHCYIGIGPTSTNADHNWAYVSGPTKGGRYAIPVKAAQSATIRLFQMAAYHADGSLMRVAFHVSFYSNNGVQVTSMPIIPAGEHYGSSFTAGQHYPFGRNAWEKYNADGTQVNPNIPQPLSTAGLIRGYGDMTEPAGYWPGTRGQGNPITGMLADETQWPLPDASTEGPNAFNPYTIKQQKMAGYIYAMVYCDNQGSEPVYFLGRMFRVEPGTSA